ncbi:MAG: DUF4440 domain-containing protein [Candidatus Aminicenantes bacterium]|nr:DUF4440 domain-containing protein [Candidatus Aminicenantes bacterium]NIM78376.1 DUF4440 domain-containing protein [Candidatus Aminicenantes bacterium]NIN17629.1 DUF4440 domain-containing protein [Candidatus Aminicenantes bacterium]NIN41505.1 DUF4440 domain-containing protein [Candidatus Aminicenantes bacterium]NIN84279.1 DUF4440 domain-containing protein [Candidatus Aminicenantes bacterium]
MCKIGQIYTCLIAVLALTVFLVVLPGCESQSQDKAKAEQAEKMKTAGRRIIEEAWNKGNFDVLDEFLAADYVYHIPPLPDVKGIEAYKQRIKEYRSAYPDLQITINEIIVEGDISALRWTLKGTHTGQFPSIPIPPTGKQVEFTGCDLAYWKDGKIVEDWNHADFLGYMQQLGFKLIPPQKEEKEKKEEEK